MRQPDPIETLQGIATMQAFTIGLLIALHFRLGHSKKGAAQVVYLMTEPPKVMAS